MREQPTRQDWGRPSDARLRTLGCRLWGATENEVQGRKAGNIFSEYEPCSSVQNGWNDMNLVTNVRQ